MSQPDARPGSPRRLWPVLLAALVPMLPYLVGLPRFGELPSNDYWGVVKQVASPEGWTADPRVWLTLRSNEHHATLPTVVYRLNVALTGGDNRGLSAFTLCCLAGVLVLLYRALPPALRAARGLRVAGAFLLSAFVFNLVQAHNVVMGFSGTMWMLSNLFSVGALAALGKLADGHRPGWLGVALACGVAGAFTYSSNLSLWPALLLAGLLWRIPWWGNLSVAGAAAAVYAFYTATYVRPAHHPELAGDLLQVVGFACAYLGSIFSREALAAALFGALGLLASVVFWALATELGRRLPPRPEVLWLALQVYVLANAVGTAIGRSGMGTQVALSSRYGNLVALFWVGLLVPLLARVATWTEVRRLPGAVRLAAWVGLAFVVLGLADRGVSTYEAQLLRASRQPVSAFAIRHAIPLSGGLESVTPVAHEVWRNVDTWRAIGHVPFDRPPDFPLGHPVGIEAASDRAGLRGAVERLRPVAGEWWEANGWISPTGRAEWIVLLDPAGRVRGLARPGFALRGRARAETPEGEAWRGWARVDAPTVLRAFAVVGEGEGRGLVPLVGRRRVAPRPPSPPAP